MEGGEPLGVGDPLGVEEPEGPLEPLCPPLGGLLLLGDELELPDEEGVDRGLLGGLELGVLGELPGMPLGMLDGLVGGVELELLLHPAIARSKQTPATHRGGRHAPGIALRNGLSLLFAMNSIPRALIDAS